MKHLTNWYFVIGLFFFLGCTKEEDIDETCRTQPMQVFLEYRTDTLFAIVPLNLSSGVEYAWQGGERSTYIVPKGAGTYTVTATDSRGCSAANTIKLGCSNGEFKIQDFDGNNYRIIEVGDQCWCVENLQARSTATGIPLMTVDEWTQNPAFTRFEGSPDSSRTGLLYNSKAAQNPLCPTGWRVPQDEDWTTLFDNLGGKEVAALKLRNVNGWIDGAGNNASGFGALPTGRVYQNGNAITDTQNAFYWNQNGNRAYQMEAGVSQEVVILNPITQDDGFAIRCMKDVGENPAPVNDNSPSISTLDATDIGYFSGRLNGRLLDANGSPVTEFGFSWKESNSISDFVNIEAFQLEPDGSFNVELDGLNDSTQYTYKAYAKNANGRGEGELQDFITDAIDLSSFSIDNIVLEATAPDQIEVTFSVASTDVNIIIQSTGLLIGRGFVPSLTNFTQKEIRAGTDFTNVSFDQIVPKRDYTLKPFVVIQGVEKELNPSANFSYTTDSVFWNEATNEIWHSDAILLNQNKLWLTVNLDTLIGAFSPLNDLNGIGTVATFENPLDSEHGSLYNGFVSDSTIGFCPAGWNLPSKGDVDALLNWLSEVYDGNQVYIANAMKSTSTSAWPNSGNNEAGFNALQSGFAHPGGGNQPSEWNPQHISHSTFWWTKTVEGNSQYWYGIENNGIVFPTKVDRRSAGSIRCIKNR